MEPIIRLKSVTKDYGQGNVIVHALNGIDLEIQKGEFTTMAGPSGSGKTSLLNLIGGLDRPTAGEVQVNGRFVGALSQSEMGRLRRDNVGFVFQNYSLLPVLTAMENAEYVLLLQSVSAKEREERVHAVLREVGLAGMEKRFPRELSGGQQQRVAIARAIVSEPSLVLADEPTANLDSKTGGDLVELMLRLNQDKGITFLFSTHDREVMHRARRLLWLKDGQIDFDGVPGQRKS